MSYAIVNLLLMCSLALLIYSWCKRKSATICLLKVMMVASLIVIPSIADEGSIGITGVWGIPEPDPGTGSAIDVGGLPGSDGGPIIVPLAEAINSLGDESIADDSWTAGAYAFLRGNVTLINSTLNNTTLVIA